MRPSIDFSPVKIGCTSKPVDRLAQIQSWSPYPLEISAMVFGTPLLEKQFHAKFADSYSHGEWFFWTEEMENTIMKIRAGTFDLLGLPYPQGLGTVNYKRSRIAKNAYLAQIDRALPA